MTNQTENKEFNLLDKPWIPVIWQSRPDEVVPEESAHTPPRKRRHMDAHRSEIGILDALEHASAIRALADSTPIMNLALLRFLIAVLHAADVTRDNEASTWSPKLDAYFQDWRDRFWLYHPEHPFMQGMHWHDRAKAASEKVINERAQKLLDDHSEPASEEERKSMTATERLCDDAKRDLETRRASLAKAKQSLSKKAQAREAKELELAKADDATAKKQERLRNQLDKAKAAEEKAAEAVQKKRSQLEGEARNKAKAILKKEGKESDETKQAIEARLAELLTDDNAPELEKAREGLLKAQALLKERQEKRSIIERQVAEATKTSRERLKGQLNKARNAENKAVEAIEKKRMQLEKKARQIAEKECQLPAFAVAAGNTGGEKYPEQDGTVGTSRLFHHLRAGADSIHFAHCLDEVTNLSQADCARGLILLPLAAIGARKGRTASLPGTGPIFLVPNGANLSDTLRVNLPDFARFNEDSPSWEGGGRPQDGLVGLLDGLTWQSRSVTLGTPDSEHMIAAMFYGSGRSTADVKTNHAQSGSGSRAWDDPHGIGSKHPDPYENQRKAAVPNDATATFHAQIQQRLAAYKPPAVRRAEQARQSARVDAVAVSGDGQFAFYHIDGRPVFNMKDGELKPTSSAQHFLNLAEKVKDENKRAFGRRKGREQRAKSGHAAEELASIVRNSLKALPHRFSLLDYERHNVAAFIQMLTEKAPRRRGGATSAKPDDERFGFVEYARLRVPLNDSYEDIVPLTDFFNHEVRNRGLLKGWRRQWAWMIARLYARYPHHESGAKFGVGFKPLLQGELRDHTERVLLNLAVGPLEETEGNLRQLLNLLARTRRKPPLRVNFEALLLDLLSMEKHQPSVVGRWFTDASNYDQGASHDQTA